jgi:hypothetical protein
LTKIKKDLKEVVQVTFSKISTPFQKKYFLIDDELKIGRKKFLLATRCGGSFE